MNNQLPSSEGFDASTRRLSRYACVACLLLGLACLFGCGDGKTAPDGGGSDPGEPSSNGQPGSVGGSDSSQDVLGKMIKAYREADSYADAGQVHLVVEPDPQQISGEADFAVTFVRPGKLRMSVYQAMVVCDGQKFRAAILDLPDQVLERDAPDPLTLPSIHSDEALNYVLQAGFAGPPPQLLFLLGDDPLKMLLEGAEVTMLAEPGRIADHDCYRVQIKRKDGDAVFWVDRESYVLRRIEYPTQALIRELRKGGRVDQVTLVAEFASAKFNGRIDPVAFQFEVSADAKVGEFFIPPHPGQLMGEKVPEFQFVDLEGNPVTRESLAGKIVVLNFWATLSEPCRKAMPDFDAVRQKYADDDQVIFLAVSVDMPQTENRAIQETLTSLGVDVPVVRDLQRNNGRVFHSADIPFRFILDGNGVGQDFYFGTDPNLATALPEILDKLLAGEDIYEEPRQRYQQELEEYGRNQERRADPNFAGDGTEQHEIPQADVAPRTQPATITLSPLWKCDDVKAPGNILPLRQKDGSTRLLVVDALKSLVEVGLDGSLIATHPLEIEETELIANLRTATGADGRRYLAAFASAQQRFHMLDENFRQVFSYPADALQSPHAGIADVQLADLDGDGTIEAYIGYWGLVGLQAASLEGQRIWSDRTIANVVRLALSGPDAAGYRQLICTNVSGSLARFDAKRQRLKDLTLVGRVVPYVVAADLDGDGQPQWCGLATQRDGSNVAIGFTLDGEELWRYPLPRGVHRQPVEQIVAGRLSMVGSGQWLLPAADGSIHIIGSDGTPLDKFNYGAVISGLATAQLDGQPLLIVSSTEGLQAWKVE
ncbi:MAG: redoxin domain-containing protein [Thermoguttaceae bacterium]